MIPRFKPYVGREELAAALHPSADAVVRFEEAFARTFGAQEAISFAYGRSALRTLLETLDIRGAEVILPAYTCSVVAHAIVLSGNTPRFVDVGADDYNMSLDAVQRAIGGSTRAIVATHLFGHPLDIDRLRGIVEAAEQRHGQKIWVVQDCAHSFGASWDGRLVSSERDVALYGLNISKLMTSIFGGMLTTNDRELAARLRARRPAAASTLRSMKRRTYLAAAMTAFHNDVYGAVKWLEDNTPALDVLTKAYHRDEKIEFPPDAHEPMLAVEAAVGLVQLRRYDDIVRRRRDNAAYYDDALGGVPAMLPPRHEGSTYSHYAVRVDDRDAVVAAARRRGIELGTVIDYCVPSMKPYVPYARGERFPHAERCSRGTINLPVHPALTERERALVADVVCATLGGHG